MGRVVNIKVKVTSIYLFKGKDIPDFYTFLKRRTLFCCNIPNNLITN